MKKTAKVVAFLLVLAAVVVGSVFLLQGLNFDVINSQGEVANKERDLLFFTLGLSLIVVIPVFVMLIVFSLRYREGNKKKAVYKPDWDFNWVLETIWWGIPIVIIGILSVVTWISTHDLDPYKPLDSDVKPVSVQVVALQWKWLFIYPEQGVASVNLLQIPEKTPINFTITSDAPMNSLWIPSLGSQIYAMSGMSTKLHLMADTVGDYKGSSANISGEGFASMRFIARSSTQSDFDAWVAKLRSSNQTLDLVSYDKLAEPGAVSEPIGYRLGDPHLYDRIVLKYMMPPRQSGSHALPAKRGEHEMKNKDIQNMGAHNMDMMKMDGM